MKKALFILILCFSVISYTLPVSACSMIEPYILVTDGGSDCNLNVVDIDEIILQGAKVSEICQNLDLSEDDITIVKAFIVELSNDFFYTKIERQSDTEYKDFLVYKDDINDDKCECAQIDLYEREQDWTVYTNTFKDTCSFTTACYQPPLYCTDNVYSKSLFWLLGIGIVLAGGIIFIILYQKKNRSIQK